MSRNIISGPPAGRIALYDSACRIVWINEAPTPYAIEEILGRVAWHIITDSQHAERLQAAMLRVLVSNHPQTIEVAFSRAGTWRSQFFFAPLAEVRIVEYSRKIPPEILLLTDRERQICRLLIEGQHTPEIADRLDASRSTVSAHRANAAHKLGLATDELVVWCGAHREWF